MMLWKCCIQYYSKFGKQQWPQDWKRSVFIPIPKKGNSKECSNYCTIVTILQASKVILKILQTRLQQYVNLELPDVQAGFRKGRDKIASIYWFIETAREIKKTSTSALLITPKPLTVWITTNCGKSLKRWEYQTTLPVSWEICMQVKKQQLEPVHVTMDWFQIGKGVCHSCILSPCLFNLYAEYIMWSARLDEAQAGIKIAGRNINNLRYADTTTLMAESKELKSLLIKVKEETEKAGLKLSIQNMKIKASSPITSWQIDAGNNGNSGRLYFGGLKNHCRWWLQPWN